MNLTVNRAKNPLAKSFFEEVVAASNKLFLANQIGAQNWGYEDPITQNNTTLIGLKNGITLQYNIEWEPIHHLEIREWI